MKNLLKFRLSEDASRIEWSAEGTPLAGTAGGDFWRIMADDGYYIEMTVHSADQKGTVRTDGNRTVITYDGLVTDAGRQLDVRLTLTITDTGEKYIFDACVENHSDARINELEYPYIDLNRLCGEREDDLLFRPAGLGERIKNPWRALASAHTEYMSSDYNEIKSTIVYPRPGTMTWMGIQSDKYFLYVGRHDERTRACCLLNAIQPREVSVPRLVSSICHYPFARNGESICTPPVVVTLAEGDWRIGSDIYGAFARSTYYHPVEPRKWVKNMTGWQRIILRHQFGEIFWKYADLPRLYLEGKQYGLDTLLVFGWWRGRFDNGYPHYEADPELGGADGLREAIAEVQRLGGHVILYNNGILIDKNTEFYREHHLEAARIDIDGNEYEDHYKFENNGTVLRNYGYKSFVDACQATKVWHDKLIENGRLKLSFSPDSIFFDQIGGRSKLCFNPAHEHGYRPDDEMVYRRRNLRDLRALLGPDQAIGTECVNDTAICEVDYIHGCDRGAGLRSSLSAPTATVFPYMFRRTFPEPVITNRWIHDCRRGWRDDLNHAFIFGMRFDVAIWRCRKIGVAGLPEYGEHLKKLLDLKEKYRRFFYDWENGRFVCDTALDLPEGIFCCEYKNGDERMFALRSAADETLTFEVCGRSVILAPQDVACVTVD